MDVQILGGVKDFILFNMCKDTKRKSVSHLLLLTTTLHIRSERNNVFFNTQIDYSLVVIDQIKDI